MALDAQFAITGSGTLTSPLDNSEPVDAVTINPVGGGGFEIPTITFSDGNGDNEAQSWWHDTRILPDATNDALDLYGTALTDSFGVIVHALKIKAIIIAIVDPDGDKELLVGPGGNAAAFVGPWYDDTMSEYVNHHRAWFDPFDGWTVTPTTADLLYIGNNSGGSVTYRIWVLFTTS